MADTTQQIEDAPKPMEAMSKQIEAMSKPIEAKPDSMKIDYDTVYLAVGDKICKGIIVKEGTYAAPAEQHLRLKIKTNKGKLLYENLNPSDKTEFWNNNMSERSRGGGNPPKKNSAKEEENHPEKNIEYNYYLGIFNVNKQKIPYSTIV